MANTNESDKYEELKKFNESKSGVKGLVDSGITKVPRIFVRPPEDLASDKPYDPKGVEIPVIDMGASEDVVVAKIQEASENLGIFIIINHGIDTSVMEEMLKAAREFHELPKEMKIEFYNKATLNVPSRVQYWSNHDLVVSKHAVWRDSLSFDMTSTFDPLDIPTVCRNAKMQYMEELERLGSRLFELLSKGLELKANHLLDMDCAKGYNVACHYNPPCPEPHLTLGTKNHTDPGFLTILFHSESECGLQILHQDKWVDVPNVPGELVVNIADLLQLISNNKYKSVNHSVVMSKGDGPRISVATFFRSSNIPRVCEPIKELLSDDNTPMYKQVTGNDYLAHYNAKNSTGPPSLECFKL